MAKKNNKKNDRKQNIKTDTKLSVYVEEPAAPSEKTFFAYGSPEIHNPDFYKAYNELLTPEKSNPTFTTFKERLDAAKKSGTYEYSSLYNSSGSRMHKPIAYHTNWAIKLESDMVDNQKKLNKQIDRSLLLGGIVIFGLVGFVVLAYLVELFIQISKHNSTLAKWFLILIVEALIVFIIIKMYNKYRPKHRAKKLIETNPYYQMASELLFIPSYRVQLDYPTKRIDSNYRRYKNNIELEWKVSSHDFITDTFFRLEPFDCRFPDYGVFRFFIEIKYEPCFPDYPELLSIEKQIRGLHFIAKDEDKPKARIGLYKAQIRDRIKELIKDRIPNMVVTNIVIAVGVLNHNFKSKDKNANYDHSFKDTYKDPVWKTASWREMIKKKDVQKDTPKDNKIIPAKDIENTDPPVL